MHSKVLFSTVVALAAAVHMPDARADEVVRDYISHGPANCQGALPQYDAMLRKRPKAVANVGESAAYVTCDFEQIPNPLRRVTSVGMYFLVSEGTSAVSCTLVQGVGRNDFAPALTKTAPEAGPGETAILSWSATIDFGGTNMTGPAVSCRLPAGMEIMATQITFLEEIGG